MSASEHQNTGDICTFVDDEEGYLQWIETHRDGYVVNTRRQPDPDYVILHRAFCPTIRSYPKMDSRPGGFTERGYSKICSTQMAALRAYLCDLIGCEFPFTRECSRCAGEVDEI